MFNNHYSTLFLLSLIVLTCQSVEKKELLILPIHEEPFHQLVFEKGPLKIMDIQIPPGDTSLYHLHAYPMFFVSLGWPPTAAQLADEKWGDSSAEWPKGGLDSDTSYASRSVVHRVTNQGNIPSRLIGLQHEGQGMVSSSDSSDYELANQWFKAKRYRLKPGESLMVKDKSGPKVLVAVEGESYSITQNNISFPNEDVWYYLTDEYTITNTDTLTLEIVEAAIK